MPITVAQRGFSPWPKDQQKKPADAYEQEPRNHRIDLPTRTGRRTQWRERRSGHGRILHDPRQACRCAQDLHARGHGDFSRVPDLLRRVSLSPVCNRAGAGAFSGK